jgi:F0F1-type ATP synthase membrane subunit c/vacuolar-type H+-ATPase subunit K
MKSASTATPEAALRVMRMIGLALGAGVTMFAVAAWVIQPGAAATPSDPPLMLYLWIAMATTLAAGSLVVWRGRVVPHLASASGGADWRERADRIQAGLVITWALVETAALFGVVVYFLDGQVLPIAAGVALMWVALAMTWPRAEWLEPERATDR